MIRDGLQWLASKLYKYKFVIALSVFIGYHDEILNALDKVPDGLIITATLISVIWISSYRMFDSVPNIRLWVIPLSIIGCMHLMNYMLKANVYIANEGIFTTVTSIIGGFVTFFLLFFVFNGVSMSIAGYTIDDIRKEKRKRINDPYGDKHAQDILNE